MAWTWTEGSGESGGGGGGSPPTATETVLFAARNPSGGVVALVDETGTPAARFDYTPYGELARAEAWSSGGGGGGGGGGRGVPGAAALARHPRLLPPVPETALLVRHTQEELQGGDWTVESNVYTT